VTGNSRELKSKIELYLGLIEKTIGEAKSKQFSDVINSLFVTLNDSNEATNLIQSNIESRFANNKISIKNIREFGEAPSSSSSFNINHKAHKEKPKKLKNTEQTNVDVNLDAM
jgi:hypothetical protein